MAMLKFKKGLWSKLPTTMSEGTIYVTTDEKAMYLDINDSTRIRLGDFQEFATLDALKANVNPSTTAMYYVDELNVLAKWNGTEYIQINTDTGATSIEVVARAMQLLRLRMMPLLVSLLLLWVRLLLPRASLMHM